MPNVPAPSATEPKRHNIRNKFGKFVSLSEDTQGENLVDIRVHNPLKRLYTFIDYLKTHG